LGYDWKIGIALITSFAAREVFVGTLATIYSVEADDENTATIKEKMASEVNPYTGGKRFTFPVGMSLLIFYAFAMQCMATLAIVKRETKSWRWPLIQLFGMGILAYISSFITYQILKLMQEINSIYIRCFSRCFFSEKIFFSGSKKERMWPGLWSVDKLFPHGNNNNPSEFFLKLY